MNNVGLLLKALSDSDYTISDLSSELEKPEGWIIEVFSGQRICPTPECSKISNLLNIDMKIVNIALNEDKTSFWGDMLKLVLDKLVFGTIAVLVALYFQGQFEEFSIERNKAAAASNLSSSFYSSRFKEIESLYVEMLIASEVLNKGILLNKDSPNNVDFANRLSEKFEKLITLINLAYISNESIEKESRELLDSMESMMDKLLVNEYDADLERKKTNLHKSFESFLTLYQNIVINLVRNEMDAQ